MIQYGRMILRTVSLQLRSNFTSKTQIKMFCFLPECLIEKKFFSEYCPHCPFKQMAEVVEETSRGLTFAEQQLLRHGWERGKVL